MLRRIVPRRVREEVVCFATTGCALRKWCGTMECASVIKFRSIRSTHITRLPAKRHATPDAPSRDPGSDKVRGACPWLPDRTPAFAGAASGKRGRLDLRLFRGLRIQQPPQVPRGGAAVRRP